MEMTGLTCLVTGGTRGIGAACVEKFAANGARVFACARRQDVLDEFLSKMKLKGYDVQGCACDVTDTESLKACVDKVTEFCNGKLNVVVNNAAVGYGKKFMDWTDEEFDRIMHANVKSVVDVCRATYPLLKASGDASVVNIGSTTGSNRVMANTCHYSMSKSALNMLTMTLACEWAADKIRVNCVAPGLVETDMSANAMQNPAFTNLYASETPMKRWAQPDEIASVVAFFASSAASYVTGQILFVDGGHTIRGMGY